MEAQPSAFCTEVNVVLSFEPKPLTTVMIATAMPAAIKPYSMAVAPDSSFQKRFTRPFTACPSSLCRTSRHRRYGFIVGYRTHFARGPLNGGKRIRDCDGQIVA